MADEPSLSLMMDRLVGSRPALLLRSAGFRKSRRAFWREVGGVWQTVSFQSSRWNTPRLAKFTVNFLLSFPGYHTMRFGRPAPRNPATTWPMWDLPIALLKGDDCDEWWSMGVDAEPAAIGTQVADDIETFGLQYFETYSSLDAVAKNLSESVNVASSPWIPTLNWSILKWCSGDRERAIHRLEECREAMSPDLFSRMIEPVLNRMRYAS